jgi:hypothetical protein
MKVELLTKHYMSDYVDGADDFPQNYPPCVYDHINSVINERNQKLEEEFDEESDEEEQEYMKLKKEDFQIFLWMIDNCQYYDICNFKDDAEVGFIMKYNNDKLTRICEVDEAALGPLDGFEHMKNWCKTFEEERVRILEL